MTTFINIWAPADIVHSQKTGLKFSFIPYKRRSNREALMEIQTIQPFLHYFGNVRERTMRVARCIPQDKLDWTYAPGKFTLGDLLRHIVVAERWMWAETVCGRASRYTTHGKELAEGLENVIAFMERLHAESMKIFAELSDEDLQGRC